MNVLESSKMAILVGIARVGCVGVYLSSRAGANETEEERQKREKRKYFALLRTGLLVGTAAVHIFTHLYNHNDMRQVSRELNGNPPIGEKEISTNKIRYTHSPA